MRSFRSSGDAALLTATQAPPRVAICHMPRDDAKRYRKNGAFVDEVAKTNVLQTLSNIRRQSSVPSALEKGGKIKIVGSMYYLIGGRVEFFT
jgi:carbonic anhydrase